jgi:3-hydroxyacyl-[acyl-carrier-protein] dehydratase
MMHLIFVVVVVLYLTCEIHAFSPSIGGGARLAQRLGQLHMSEPPKEGEWLGAKKFSMNNRYTQTVLSSEQISKILPHRYPILLVDRVIEMLPGKKIVGIKCITANEPQFTGHFPDRPIMPGVLMIEAMAQLGGILCLQPPVSTGEGQKIFFFTGVSGVRWKTPVTPGDQLIMEMELLNFDDRLGFATLTGKAYVGGKIAVSVEEFTFALAR